MKLIPLHPILQASLKWKESTLDTNKQNVSSQIAAMNAATAQVVTLTAGPPEEVDHTAVGAAITTITSNLPEMTRGVRMIAALMDDENSGDRLLDAARRLCNAFSDLLRAAEPETREVLKTFPTLLCCTVKYFAVILLSLETKIYYMGINIKNQYIKKISGYKVGALSKYY